MDEGLGAIDYGHGTHVAGIISGKGSYQDYIISGTSPDASLLISRIFGRDIDGDSKLDNYYDIDLDGYQLWKVLLDPDGDGNTLDSYSADVISCSWSDEKNYGVYDLWSKTVDDIISGKMFVKRPIFVFAAGNSGNYNLISPPATSKNSIVVGSCINFDCSIPAKYTQLGSGCGILKPDIFAPGNNIISSIPYSISRFGYGKFSGTSMATPFVSSVAAQLVKLYSSFSKPEFVKAMIISSSYGGSTTDSKSTEKGWGRLSVYQTLFKVDDEILDYYDIGIVGNRHTPYPREKVYKFDIENGVKYLVATLVYSDDSSPLGTCNVLNDLDLYLVSPSGSTKLPSGFDTKNDEKNDVVEKYIITNPEPGTWELHVNATNLNDLDESIPKYIEYAISLRAISKEDLKIYYNIEGNIIKLRAASSLYACTAEVTLKSDEKIDVTVGDMPAGVEKKIETTFPFTEISNLKITCFNFSGHRVEPEIIHDPNTTSSANSGSESNEPIQRIILPYGDKMLVAYLINGITVGGISERFGKDSEIIGIYTDSKIKYNFSNGKFVASWYGNLNLLILEIKTSEPCSFGGHYLDITKSFDPLEIPGGRCSENDINTIKYLTIQMIKHYILEKNGYLKELIIKSILYYLYTKGTY